MSETKHSGIEAVLYGLGKLEGMMTSLQNSLDGHKKDTERGFNLVHERIDGHNERITSLEATKHQATGGVMVAKLVVPLVWALLVGIVGVAVWLASPGIQNLAKIMGVMQ